MTVRVHRTQFPPADDSNEGGNSCLIARSKVSVEYVGKVEG